MKSKSPVYRPIANTKFHYGLNKLQSEFFSILVYTRQHSLTPAFYISFTIIHSITPLEYSKSSTQDLSTVTHSHLSIPLFNMHSLSPNLPLEASPPSRISKSERTQVTFAINVTISSNFKEIQKQIFQLG